jgi:hypothetical protein
VYNRQFGRLRGTIGDEAANLGAFLVYEALRAGAVRAGDEKARELLALAAARVEKAVQNLPTDPASPPSVAEDALSALTFGSMTPAELVACKKALLAELDRGAAGQQSSYPLDEECANGAPSVECHLGSAVRSGLQKRPPATQDHLVKATALVVRQVAGTALAPSPDQPKKLDAVERQVLFLLRKELSGDTWEGKLPEGAFAGLEVLDLPARLAELHATWRSVVDAESGKIDVLAYLRTVASERGPLAALCEGRTVPACAVVRLLPLVAKPGNTDALARLLNDVKPILVYSARGETAEAAQLALAYLFQRISADNNEEVSVHQRFVQSVAGYVLDAADGQPPSETARVAFRKASVEMIQHLGQGSGIRRRYATLGSAVKIFFLPDLALRASWSGSYVNDSGTARILASANWLNFRFRIQRTEASYVGIETSLLDPLAPLSELALRRTERTHYRKPNTLLLNLLTPRVEVLAASPMLSEHLAVSAGLSLRLAAPLEDATPRADGEASYHYAPVWNAKDQKEKSLWPRFLEFGFAAKYLL